MRTRVEKGRKRRSPFQASILHLEERMVMSATPWSPNDPPLPSIEFQPTAPATSPWQERIGYKLSSPSGIAEGQTISLNAYIDKATATQASKFKYRWDLDGNGTYETFGQNATYKFDDNAIRTVGLRVIDALGVVKNTSIAVPVANLAPQGDFSLMGDSIVNTAITFQSDVTDPGSVDQGSGFYYAWDFGDGATSTEQWPTHAFENVGEYRVSLTVTDKDGLSSTVTKTIVANPSLDDALATIHATPGFATFGQVLPQGQAFEHLTVGVSPTQVDVKTVWPDGSIKFAVVTTQLTTEGDFVISESTSSMLQDFMPVVPDAVVRFDIGGVLYQAELPDSTTTDMWLDGPLVKEWRTEVAPIGADGVAHPFLRVFFDTRVYFDGSARVDVDVENTLNISSAGLVTYDVDIDVNGVNRFHRDDVKQAFLTRWRQVLDVGLSESQITMDFDPFYEAGALGRVMDGLGLTNINSATGPSYDILKPGAVLADMASCGGRPELGPLPAWTAKYLSTQHPQQREFVLANGDLAGSWPIHIREDGVTYQGLGDSRYVSIDERPLFWLDHRASVANRPFGKGGGSGLAPELNHTPTLSYVPYLITGDRYHADELAAWANYTLIKTWEAGNAAPNAADRGGSAGLLYSNEVPGFAWSLRNLADAAAYLPDNDDRKAHFVEKVQNNLNWVDSWAASARRVQDVAWIRYRQNDPADPERQYVWNALWEHNYLAWSLDHVSKLGFEGGTSLRDQIARYQISLFNSPGYDIAYAAPYAIAMGQKTASGMNWFANPGETFAATSAAYATNPGFASVQWPTPIAGYYGVDARLMAMIGVENGWQGAQEAYDYVNSFLTNDLKTRANWAFTCTACQG